MLIEQRDVNDSVDGGEPSFHVSSLLSCGSIQKKKKTQNLLKSV